MATPSILQKLYDEKETLRAYARGVAGGLLFATPLLYTMEMWWLGFYLHPVTLLLALFANFCILLILEHYSGFRDEDTFLEEVQDAIVALGLAIAVSVIILLILNLLRPGMSLEEMAGKVIMQAIAVSIGISVAISELGQPQGEPDQKEERKEQAQFWGTQAIGLAGAVFFGLNIAATEEPQVVGLQMKEGHILALLILLIILVFAITYALDFRGESEVDKDRSLYHVFLKDSLATTATALLCSATLLFALGRINLDTGLTAAIHMIIVLGFVTALGASAARLLI